MAIHLETFKNLAERELKIKMPIVTANKDKIIAGNKFMITVGVAFERLDIITAVKGAH